MNTQSTDTKDEAQGAGGKAQGSRFKPCFLPLAPCSSKGFTLIELIVTIAIISTLAYLLLTRVWFYQEQAEKAAMEQVAGALQSSLVMQYGQLLTQGKEAEVNSLITENPTRWLQRVPANYAGDIPGVTFAAIPPGNWAFDPQTRELIYVPGSSEYFTLGKDGLKWVRYRARLLYEPRRGALAKTGKSKGAEVLTGVLFEPVEPYQWMIKGEE